jgi:hypothetical protein
MEATLQETSNPLLVDDGGPIPQIGYIISRYTTETTATELLCDKDSKYTYFGPFLPLSLLPLSLRNWSERNIKGDILPYIKRFMEYVHCFLSHSFPQYDCYWFEIRLSKGSEEYIIPRWHHDGVYFDTQKDDHFKLVTTLLGPGTLFLKDGAAAREIDQEEGRRVVHILESLQFENHEAEVKEARRLQDKRRMSVAKRLDGWERVQPSCGEYARFRVGSGAAAVHSEPDSRGDRVFVSVLPGTEGELREMAGTWGCTWDDALS